MVSRKPIVAMSWAMRQNKKEDAQKFARELISLLDQETKVEKILFPSMGTINYVAEITKSSNIGLGAQNISTHMQGEFSGEYSIESLVDCGGRYVEIGHWERKIYNGETYKSINKKINIALKNEVIPIVCVGEEEKIDDYTELYKYLKLEIFNILYEIPKELANNIVIAYTPKWAVGKTRAASAPYVHKAGELLRTILEDYLGSEYSEGIRIIYGGSVSPENAALITQNPLIDGVLIGRFGSSPSRYAEVVNVVEKNKVN